MVQWDQYPTYQDGTVNFKGTLLNDAVFSHPGSTPRQGTEVYPNFRGRLASDRLYLGSVLPQGSTLPLSGYRLYPFDVIADSYQLDGQSFTVSFTFPEGLEGAPSDYVITVYGFQDETRVPIIDTYRDSGAFVDLLGYARIRVLAPSPTATATETATPVPVITLASLYGTQNTRWLVRKSPALAGRIQSLRWVEDGLSDLERQAIDELLYIAVGGPNNLEVSLGLPWVQDDITETERDALERLSRLAHDSEQAAATVITLPWVQDDITGTERDALEWIGWLAKNSEQAASAINALPWVQDDITDTERDALEWLSRLAQDSEQAAATVTTLPWVQDDITGTERDALEWIRWLAKNSEQAAAAINALPWVQDNITETERDALKWLSWLAHYSEEAAVAVTTLPWVQDDITETERDALEWLSRLAQDSEQAAATVTTLPWVQDDITGTERDALEWIRWLAKNSEQAAAAINALPWVQDDITETERDALEWLSWLAHYSEQAAVAVATMPWVQDDITDTEAEALKQISRLNDDDDKDGIAVIEAIVALSWVQDDITETEAEFLDFLEGLDGASEQAAATVTTLPWVQDDITGTERDALEWIRWLAHDSDKAAAAIIAMPFLKSLEPDDVLAVRGILRLATDDDDSLLATLINHPSLRNGITDAQTTLVTAAGTMWDADEIHRLLNPDYADIEILSSSTMLTPDLKVSIVRTGTQSQPWTAEGARDAVEFAEKIMQLPLPVSHGIVVLNEKAVPPQYGGANYGIAFSYNPEREQGQTPHDRHTFLSGLVHETAHYYWQGHSAWIDEGVANIFEYMYGVESGVSPGLVGKTRREDCEIHDLETLTELIPDPEEDFDQFHCNYFLGQMLFLEMLENLGEEEFNGRLRELYRLSIAAKEDDRTPGIAEVRRAFHDQTDVVEKHWSGKLNAPANRPFDEGIDRTSHDLIQWDQYPTFLDGEVTLKGTPLKDAIYVAESMRDVIKYERLAFTFVPVDGREHLGSILPYEIATGWQWSFNTPGDVQASTFVIFQADKRFHIKFTFPSALGAPEDVVIGVWGYQNADREATIGDKVDLLGYARIRVEPES